MYIFSSNTINVYLVTPINMPGINMHNGIQYWPFGQDIHNDWSIWDFVANQSHLSQSHTSLLCLICIWRHSEPLFSIHFILLKLIYCQNKGLKVKLCLTRNITRWISTNFNKSHFVILDVSRRNLIKLNTQLAHFFITTH